MMKNLTNERIFKAFTLAEVLITIVIIGVIAAITVPTLITKYQKEQTVTRLKKAYSTLSQTTQKAIADYGPVKTWELGEADNPDDMILFINKYILPYLNLSKKPEKLENNNWNPICTYLNGSDATYNNTYVRFYLSDGTSVTCRLFSNSETNKRVMMRVDINGDKKPNKYSRDIFSFDYYILSADENRSGKFVPSGMEQINRENLLSDSPYQCNKNQVGVSCAALIMKDGWQIKDDYPW